MSGPRRVVVKVGGSLFDLPDLGPRLAAWLQALSPAQVLLVPGGGALADVVRTLDRRFHLGDAVAHDLALRAMNLNAAFLAALLGRKTGNLPPIRDPHTGWSDALVCLDAHAFCSRDTLSASWETTSDSIAARAALVFDADELVLLKSVTLPEPCDWDVAAAAGQVDPLFPGLARRLRSVRAVNLRMQRL